MVAVEQQERPASPEKRRPRDTWRAWMPTGAPEPTLITRSAMLNELKRHPTTLELHEALVPLPN